MQITNENIDNLYKDIEKNNKEITNHRIAFISSTSLLAVSGLIFVTCFAENIPFTALAYPIATGLTALSLSSSIIFKKELKNLTFTKMSLESQKNYQEQQEQILEKQKDVINNQDKMKATNDTRINNIPPVHIINTSTKAKELIRKKEE